MMLILASILVLLFVTTYIVLMYFAKQAINQTQIIAKWIIENVDDSYRVVPMDEGCMDGFQYNLLQILYFGDAAQRWDYKRDQHEFLAEQYHKFGLLPWWEEDGESLEDLVYD